MSPPKSDSTVYQKNESILTNNRPDIEHLRKITLDPVSQSSPRSNTIQTVEDNEETKLLQSALDSKLEEQVKHKPSWIELLKTRINSLFNSPIFLASLSSLIITMNSFMVKILAREYSVIQITAVRGIIGLFIILCFMFWKGVYPLGERNKAPILFIRGLLGAIAIFCAWIAISLLQLSESSFLWNSHPMVTAVLASVTGMEKLNWMSWVGVGGTAIGNALVAHPPFLFGGHEDWTTTRSVGLAVCCISVLAMGSSFIIIKKIGGDVHPFVHSTYQLSTSVILSIPFLFASYPKKFKVPDGTGDVGLFLLVSVGVILAQVTTIAALQRGSPTLVTSLLMTNMISSSLLGVFVLSERFSWVSGSGALIVLVSVLLVVLTRGLSKKQEYKPLLQTEEVKEIEL